MFGTDSPASAARPGSIRQPAVAGTFYPADAVQCRLQAEHFIGASNNSTGSGVPGFATTQDVAAELIGAVVPHAGWICSGAIAGLSIAAIAAVRPDVEVVVVFGAVHTPAPLATAALDSHAAWREPAASCGVAWELRQALAGDGRLFAVNDFFHQREHAVEVVLPLIQAAWPMARVLPVEVPVTLDAMRIGTATARAAQAAGIRPIYLASSDLTHYGPNYQFAPAGVGPTGINWAMENDRRLLELVTNMRAEQIVPEAAARRSACGPGAIAAMLAACMEHGAKHARLLKHTNSFQVLQSVATPFAKPSPDNSVGYAAVVVGK